MPIIFSIKVPAPGSACATLDRGANALPIAANVSTLAKILCDFRGDFGDAVSEQIGCQFAAVFVVGGVKLHQQRHLCLRRNERRYRLEVGGISCKSEKHITDEFDPAGSWLRTCWTSVTASRTLS